MNVKKQVTMEMIAKAVEHSLAEHGRASRGRVMAFMARPENGGCAGDPGNVQQKIREYMAGRQGGAAPPALEEEAPVPAQHEAIRAILDQGATAISRLWNDLDAGLARALAAIKEDAAEEYERLAARVRKDAASRIAVSEQDEADASAALQEALEQRQRATEDLEAMKAALAGATAIAEDRGVRGRELEAALANLQGEMAARIAEMQATLDNVRVAAAESAATLRERDAAISALEANLARITDESTAAREQASAAAAIAEERATMITDLETSLAEVRAAANSANEQASTLRERVRALEAPHTTCGLVSSCPKTSSAKREKRPTKQQREDLERIQAVNDPHQRQFAEMLEGGETP